VNSTSNYSKTFAVTHYNAPHKNRPENSNGLTISEIAADWHEMMILYPSALCGHLMLTPAKSWTRGLPLADIPPSQSPILTQFIYLLDAFSFIYLLPLG